MSEPYKVVTLGMIKNLPTLKHYNDGTKLKLHDGGLRIFLRERQKGYRYEITVVLENDDGFSVNSYHVDNDKDSIDIFVKEFPDHEYKSE